MMPVCALVCNKLYYWLKNYKTKKTSLIAAFFNKKNKIYLKNNLLIYYTGIILPVPLN